MSNEQIAIVGLGIIAPDAPNKDQFWRNITSGRNCVSEVPKDRWDWQLYYSEDKKAVDKTYSKIGGFIKDFTFEPIKYKIPPQTASQISRLQQITIEAVRMAFEDSGYDKKAFDPRKAGVIIGNAMGAMRKELTDLRVYKFYNEDLIKKTKAYAGLTPAQQKDLMTDYEDQIDRNILKITEDTMPGELSNVTAGRIANVFNLNGPNMTMDAACASSLAALDYAVMGLRTGKIDMAVAGGADEMMSAPAFVKFCKIGALSANGSYSFDERADGFVMAEAVAVYILKRRSDAERDGDKIYALINSVGASSDGKGKGITAPNPKGQKYAIENAFAQVTYGPGEVDFVEAHGTATKVGDAAEVEALKDIFGPHIKAGKKLGLTSIKSQIGHAKAAAGAVSLVKTALALHHKTYPLSINYAKPNPGIDLNLFRVIDKTEPWETTGLRRANVSSFGFGGANFHVTMEEYTGKNQPGALKTAAASMPAPATSVEVKENPKTPFSGLQGEAFTFTAPTPKAVMAEAKSLSASTFVHWPDTYPMALFAQPMNARPQEEWGVSIVAKNPADLREKIEFLNANAKPETWDAPPLNFRLKGVYTFRRKKHDAKIGFLFPGQGSQYVDMMRDLAAKYDVVQETFNEADRILEKMIGVNLTGTLWSRPGESKEELEKREAAIKQTQMTQPAMMTADMAMFRLLTSFGIKPDMVIGHSLGEYAAATAAGVFTLENGLRAVTSRAKEMSSVKVKDPGKMASIGWPSEKVEKELKKIDGYVIAANKNCPLQTVIAGECSAVEKAVARFVSLGVQAQEIAVSHAFHSSIIEPAIGPYRKFLENIPTAPWTIPLLSNVTADYFPADKQGTYDLLLKQMTSPVEFIKQLERMYADGVRTFIECGPKRVLSAFAASTLKGKEDITVLSSNHPKRGGITELNDLLANLMALGFKLDWDGKLPETSGKFFNPYYRNWALQQSVGGGSAGAADRQQRGAGTLPADKASFAERSGFNFNPIAVSGIAGGAPGTWGKLFREHNLDEILAGTNMIEPIPADWRAKQINKNIIRVIKSPTGNHSIAKIDSVDQAIKLSARAGQFDIEKEFGVPNNIAKALDSTFKMAMAAGILALKDAGLPLIHYYKKTTTGSYLPEKWALPEPLASETGVVFASAFPTMESLISEVAGYFNYKHKGKGPSEMWEVYDALINKVHSPEDKQALRIWVEANFGKNHAGSEKDMFTFSQNFLMKVIPIADSQFAQWVGAKGPAMHISAACASTTQAVHTAECWLRAGKAKRVVVIAADDITNDIVQEWTMPGFLASGTASTKENVAEAALPFDKRRDGLIVGAGAVAMVIEDETLVRNRGMKPLARLLLTESANSAYHVSRLDTEHVAEVMSKFVKKIEDIYGLDKSQFAKKTFFMSHETYTPARGGSASAEVKALKKAFGAYAQDVIISNVKGFTGHTMGASLEEAVAIRALNTGIIPPIANYKEPDPELSGITLSKGGEYDLQYVLRFAAGFGSHMAMSFTERVYKEGEARIEDAAKHTAWLKALSGEDYPELEVTFNTLRIKDKKTAGKPPHTPAKEPAMAAAPISAPVRQAAAPAPAHQHYSEPKSATAPLRAPAGGLNEETVKAEILNMIADKTGYPKDMLELDLDMEADLGIDTVKQAELFAAIREHYSIARKENLSLKDYPTIRHCIKYVLDETGGTAGRLDSVAARQLDSLTAGQLGSLAARQPDSQTTQAATQFSAPAVQPSSRPAATQFSAPATQLSALNEDSVKAEILTMIADKTGYPKDMLELDLDMEADLGIDTVKQAELFAAIREHYSIARKENLSLKDYPTIRHCIKYVMDETGGTAGRLGSGAARQLDSQTALAAQPFSAPAVHPSSRPAAQPSALNEDSVKAEILTMIADKTGYPKDMLELDLDMEADLGIDTVKQAELFAAIREHYNIARKENLSLKDYPTIRHCIKYVMDETGGTAGQLGSQTALAAQPFSAPAVQPSSHPAAQPSALNEDSVKAEVLTMIADKTGYPKDMLELDLDMEADLGIDTVKQAELFAAIREHYNIARKENLSLKDYPTIRHCIKYVMDETGGTAGRLDSGAARQLDSQTALAAQPFSAPAVKPSRLNQDSVQAELPYPKRHIRYVPAIIAAPVENEIITKLSSKRPVVIFGEDLDLIKAFRSELNKHRIESFAFTSAKTKLKDTIHVDYKDLASVEKAVSEFAAAHDNVQGVFYLMGCVIKGLGKETNAFEDLKRYVMPLFLAGKHFNGGLNKLEDGHTTFLAVVTTLDGGFGYKTREVYDPIYGAIHGITLCLRKELDKCVVKLLDFEPHASPQTLVQKTFYEILYSDKRLAAGYADNKRWTLIGKPELLEKDKERTPLKGKKVLITGGGRGLGALFAKTIAAQHKPHIVILDIIELNADSARFAAMSEEELKTYKTGTLWAELKQKMEKATPAILEREFTKLKDSAQLYRSVEELKALGVKVSYYRCDLTNKESFDSVMNNIKADLGQLDGVVHFAGLERSKLVVDKTLDEFFLIFNVKCESAVNMMKSGIVKEKGFWVMASSIAGKFGNLGQSDYAAASDYMAKLTISLTNKGVRAFSVDMTAYANIGMGIRPGVEAFLKSQELDFLYPEEGMNALADELVYGRVPEIILSGSLGKLDWDKQLRFDPNFPDAGGSEFHFLERAVKNVKGLEFEASKELSIEKDPYLADHAINGTPYLPGVMGIETFAEAAAAISGERPRAIKDLRFTVPVKLLRGKPMNTIIRANASRGGYDLRLESDFVNAKGVKLGSTKTHFSARFEPGTPKSAWGELEKPELPKHAKYKITAEEIYKIYFHGPSFRVLDGILSIEKDAVLGVFKKPSAALWRVKAPGLLLHPLVLEAMFQTCGWRDIHFDRKMMLPDAVGQAMVYDNNPDPDRLYTYAVYKGTTEDGKTRYDAYAFDSEMNPVAELKDYLGIPTQI
ncbi:MAG: hypothetical protein A2218_11375 [Elusimicrobia bacterium RIFOXYA2_FULL_53_38]|nr:MAG: hypothetical protein A2218_11375 [Elusimicrobia bacterium RIFOXYA2_FULL_53_38]